MPYVADKPGPGWDPEELRRRIPGWGADVDPADRPSFPKEKYDPETGAHWEFPERQPETHPRERSVEHAFVTPVFGTAQPLHGLSGKVRRVAYDRYSEGSLAHWMLLVLGDRVDAFGANVKSLTTLRPDNPITETGILGEPRRHPIASRRGNRADRKHMWMDPILVAGPWALSGWLAFRLLRRRRG